MKLRYGCLILDHDDTVVDSSATIHHPAYLETMRRLRPNLVPVDLDGWFIKNFHPGIMDYLTDELGFTDEEMEVEYEVWRSFSSTRIPHFYPGIADLLRRYTSLGGQVAVISHSEKDIIQRDYRSQGLAVPELIYGWEQEPEKRKPSPWPVQEIMRKLDCSADRVLVVDDLKPAVTMAKAAGVGIGAAGWGHAIPVIADFMTKHCDYYFAEVSALERTLIVEKGTAP